MLLLGGGITGRTDVEAEKELTSSHRRDSWHDELDELSKRGRQRALLALRQGRRMQWARRGRTKAGRDQQEATVG